MGMQSDNTDPLLRSYGRCVQYGAALFLFGGVSMLVARLYLGEWPDIPEWEQPTGVVRLMSFVITGFAACALLLGHSIKRGSSSAAGLTMAMSTALLTFWVLMIFRTGHGWYAAGVTLFIVVHSFLALIYTMAKRIGASSDDDRREES